MLDKIKMWLLWRKIKSGKEHLLIKKGCGYYIPVRVIGVNPIGRLENWEMKSGKTAIVKLLEYSCFNDPNDMIKESTWAFLGYIGEPKVSEMTFHQFMELYTAKGGK